MENKIQKYISEHLLFNSKDKILIGLSGGRDSIFLSLILKNLGYTIALAHCNFNLRGKESDGDEAFVTEFAKSNQLELFKTHFQTEEYAKRNGVSIQMAARELRYNWFEKTRIENNFNCIAIAHNRDDIIETFFINLIRGTGIEGLSGIKSKNNRIIRPILDISRNEINQYLNKHKINFREDSSNASTKYIRNKLRHNILPEFKNISEQFDKKMAENIHRINNTNQVYKNEIQFQKSKLFIELSDRTKINIERLKKLDPLNTYLYEFLKPYSFSASTINDIVETLDSESGKVFYSKSHRINKDREDLIITAIKTPITNEIFFDKNDTQISSPINLKIENLSIDQFQLSKQKNIVALDIDKLSFPLLLRKWKHGDYFMPLGMTKMKKLSDFLINAKISMVDKENIFVIQSKNDIVWVVGQRLDDRYKITTDTKNILRITL